MTSWSSIITNWLVALLLRAIRISLLMLEQGRLRVIMEGSVFTFFGLEGEVECLSTSLEGEVGCFSAAAASAMECFVLARFGGIAATAFGEKCFVVTDFKKKRWTTCTYRVLVGQDLIFIE